MKDEIMKIHRQTCVPELKEASRLRGCESCQELERILERCQCMQIAILINTMSAKKNIFGV